MTKIIIILIPTKFSLSLQEKNMCLLKLIKRIFSPNEENENIKSSSCHINSNTLSYIEANFNALSETISYNFISDDFKVDGITLEEAVLTKDIYDKYKGKSFILSFRFNSKVLCEITIRFSNDIKIKIHRSELYKIDEIIDEYNCISSISNDIECDSNSSLYINSTIESYHHRLPIKIRFNKDSIDSYLKHTDTLNLISEYKTGLLKKYLSDAKFVYINSSPLSYFGPNSIKYIGLEFDYYKSHCANNLQDFYENIKEHNKSYINIMLNVLKSKNDQLKLKIISGIKHDCFKVIDMIRSFQRTNYSYYDKMIVERVLNEIDGIKLDQISSYFESLYDTNFPFLDRSNMFYSSRELARGVFPHDLYVEYLKTKDFIEELNKLQDKDHLLLTPISVDHNVELLLDTYSETYCKLNEKEEFNIENTLLAINSNTHVRYKDIPSFLNDKQLLYKQDEINREMRLEKKKIRRRGTET